MSAPLTDLFDIDPAVEQPHYDRRQLRPRILHIGSGAFFRAHTAAYNDAALAGGGDWGIVATSLRSTETVDALAVQDGLYTLFVRGTAQTDARIIGCVISTIAAAREPHRLLELLADPHTAIVSLTVTEKAYGIDPASGGLDTGHPDIAADLASPRAPRGLVGYLVEGLARRRAAKRVPFTSLCCDNLPNNGALLKRLVLEFAERRDPELARWIDDTASFPSTMVDRITPASTDATLADAERLTGRRDLAAVETEPFSQWIIEDSFAAGRPDWERAGALFVEDVTPYEKMKLRMLNGSHSLIAYLGFPAGHEFVRDAMADARFAQLVRLHMQAAAATLDPVPGIDLDGYADQLVARFTNRAMAHRTYQIAMDGTQKLPQRLLEPASELLARGDGAQTFALAVAAWMRYALGRVGTGRSYDLRDPRGAEIVANLQGVQQTGQAVAAVLFAMPGLFPPSLSDNAIWRSQVEAFLDLLIADDMEAAIAAGLR